MKVLKVIINGYKVRICRVYFCVGIGMDQFTPVYHRFSTGESLGPVKTKQSTAEVPPKNIKPQSKNMATSNYNKRARNKD